MSQDNDRTRVRTIIYSAGFLRGFTRMWVIQATVGQVMLQSGLEWLIVAIGALSIGSVFAGSFLAGRFGRKKVLLAESIILAASVLAFMVTGSFWALIPAASAGLFGAIGMHEWSLESSELAALSQRQKPLELVGRLSLHSLFPLLGAAAFLLLGLPVFSAFLAQRAYSAGSGTPYAAPILWGGFALALSLVALYAMLGRESDPQPEPEEPEPGQVKRAAGVVALYTLRKVAVASAAVLIIRQTLAHNGASFQIPADMHITYPPMLNGWNGALIPNWISATAAGLVLAWLAAPWLTRRLGLGGMCGLATALGCAALLRHIMLPTSPSAAPWLLAGFALIAMGDPAIRALVLTQLPEKKRDLACAITSAVGILGSAGTYYSWMWSMPLPFEVLTIIALLVAAGSSLALARLSGSIRDKNAPLAPIPSA